ncbi:site-specific DNA-methyltransferase, partial [Escherichia coli]|nr:site-specific DNA-methyltransferase [Escherichia coli]
MANTVKISSCELINADYLEFLDQCLAQFWRVLKPAGSLYLFCGHRLASDIEIMMRER